MSCASHYEATPSRRVSYWDRIIHSNWHYKGDINTLSPYGKLGCPKKLLHFDPYLCLDKTWFLVADHCNIFVYLAKRQRLIVCLDFSLQLLEECDGILFVAVLGYCVHQDLNQGKRVDSEKIKDYIYVMISEDLHFYILISARLLPDCMYEVTIYKEAAACSAVQH